ncbi:MAG: hypothetical protein QOH93_1638 [Chloroflexia bacterium]|jgi:hypothetical protein|nr:hypothetical protein [Chloroflexia bacterium]
MDETERGDGERGDWQYVDGRAVRQGQPARILPGDPEDTQPVSLRSSRLEPYEPSAATSGMRNVGTKSLARTEAPYQPPQEAPPTVVKVRRGPTACVILAGTFAILALSCALLGFATLQGGLDRLGGVFPSFSFGITPTVTINSQPAVISQIRSLSRLETVNYQLEKVVTGKSSGPLPDLLTSDKILLVAHGEVVAGVDLSKLKPEDVTVLSGTVTIRMPKAEVLFTRLDNDKTYVYDRQTGILSKPDPNLETQMRRVAEQEILQAALEDGILNKARDNAQAVLRTLVTGLGYKDVRFKEAP